MRWWLLAIGLAFAGVARGQLPSLRSLDLYFIDVEGGAATLIVTPRGESVLIDSGWRMPDRRDALRIHHALTRLAGCSRLDHVVHTHWHRDHFGAIGQLAEMVPVDRFWDRGIPESLAEDPQNFPVLIGFYRQASRGRSAVLEAGDRLPLASSPGMPDLALECVVANERPIGGGGPTACERHPARPVDPSDNAKSIGLKLTFGRFEYLNLGDLTWNVEHRLVCPRNRLGRIDLFQVTHHGLDSSNHPAVVEAIRPQVAVMANGPRKGGAASVIRTLKEQPSLRALYQLHRNVQIPAEQNAPRERIANWDERCQGEPITISVRPDGLAYTVTVGTRGATQTFWSR